MFFNKKTIKDKGSHRDFSLDFAALLGAHGDGVRLSAPQWELAPWCPIGPGAKDPGAFRAQAP
jgi:hypothetical protein